MLTCRVHVRPTAPWCLGKHGKLSQTDLFPHSDTIWSALVCIASRLGWDTWLERVLPTAERPAGFLTSSWFPRWDQELFYPRPLSPPRRLIPHLARTYTSASFISTSLWQGLGAGLSTDRLTLLGEHCLVTDTQAQEARSASLTELIRWSSVSGTAIQSSAAVSFNRQVLVTNTQHACGWWGLVRCQDHDVPTLKTLLAELGVHGLGGERSSGYGGFEVERFDPVPTPAPSGTRFMTLSLYNPTQREVEGGVLEGREVAYQTITRGGWATANNNQRAMRAPVRMITEGSVLSFVAADFPGRFVQVTPSDSVLPHPIWRAGLAWPLTLGEGWFK